jgi:hypothetical protein
VRSLRLRRAGPDPTQTLLLQAMLRQDEQALVAYRAWLERVDVTDLPPDTARMLPWLHSNLVRLGHEDEHTSTLALAHRQSWVRNTRLLHAAESVLEAWSSAGIETMLLKGAALVADGSVTDSGVRPMADADVLFPRAQVEEALHLAEDLGWTWGPTRPVGVELAHKQSSPIRDPHGHEIDLHWQSLFDPGQDDALWRRSRPATLRDVGTRVPGTADQVVQTILHALGWHPAPWRWIPDVVALSRRDEHPVEWTDVVGVARERGAAHRVASALEIVDGVVGLPEAKRAIDELRRERLTVRERALQEIRDRDLGSLKLYVISWDHARRSRALGVQESRLEHVYAELGVQGPVQVVGDLVGRGVRKLRRGPAA